MIREKYGSWPFIASMTANAFQGICFIILYCLYIFLIFDTEDKDNCLNAGMNSFLVRNKTIIS